MLTAAAPTSQVADSFSLWSERFDREMQDVFAIQDDIARAIMAALKLRLAGRSDQPVFNSSRHRSIDAGIVTSPLGVGSSCPMRPCDAG
jgi:hypothetical protein